MDVDSAPPLGGAREGSDSPFVQVNAESYPYTPDVQAGLEQTQHDVRAALRQAMAGAEHEPAAAQVLAASAFLFDSLLSLEAGRYPPLSAEERSAILDDAPGSVARAQATYYLLRDRVLAAPPARPEEGLQLSVIEPHPSATRWAARNALRLTRQQRVLVDALWLIDHGHLDLGVDTLIELVAASKPTLFKPYLTSEAVLQIFFRLAARAESERIEHANLPPNLRNHSGSRPPATKRFVHFTETFLQLGIATLFSPGRFSQDSPRSALSRRAVEAYLINVCRVRSFGEAWKWLDERFGPAGGYEYAWNSESMYSTLFVALIESIASPSPLRRQLLEIVSLPLSQSDIRTLDTYATKVPPTSTNSQAVSHSRKARAVIAEVLFIRYIQSGRYSDALALDAQLELQSAQFEPDNFERPGFVSEAEEFEARRKRRANLLRAARDVMPGVQRSLLDVRRVQTAIAAAGTAPPQQRAQGGSGVEGSWQDVSREDALGDADGDADMDVSTPSPKEAPNTQTFKDELVPLSASAALRGKRTAGAGNTASDRTAAPTAAIVHASDPQAALISALVSNSVDIDAQGTRSGPRKSQSSHFDSSFIAQSRGARISGNFGRSSVGLGGDSSLLGVGTPRRTSPLTPLSARVSPAPGPIPTRASPFGVRGRSSLAGGAPSPASFASPRRTLSGQLDLSAVAAADSSSIGPADRSSSPAMHLAHLFRQPERRYVATVDIPVSKGGGGATTERWAADQNMRLNTNRDGDFAATPTLSALADQASFGGDGTILPETPTEEEEDPANRTLKPSTADADGDEDGDTSVRMPGAWDAVQTQQSTKSKRAAGARGAGAKGPEGRAKRSRRAANVEPSIGSAAQPDQPGPISSTPAARRTTNALSSSSRNPRARPPPPPSGLRRMTRASSVLSVSSSGDGDDTQSIVEEDDGEDADSAALPDMIEVGGHAPPTVVRTTTTTTVTAKTGGRRQTRASKTTTSTKTTASGPARTRRSSRLASQEPEDDDAVAEGDDDDNDNDGVSVSGSESGMETEEDGSQIGDEDEGSSRTGGRRTRKRAPAGSRRTATATKRTSSRTKARK
ncbi:hypothetical protein OC835_001133 [Tilletia horrida]|nr:hypothetical protein OC835_001133 [Tilletia horrida]